PAPRGFRRCARAKSGAHSGEFQSQFPDVGKSDRAACRREVRPASPGGADRAARAVEGLLRRNGVREDRQGGAQACEGRRRLSRCGLIFRSPRPPLQFLLRPSVPNWSCTVRLKSRTLEGRSCTALRAVSLMCSTAVRRAARESIAALRRCAMRTRKEALAGPRRVCAPTHFSWSCAM